MGNRTYAVKKGMFSPINELKGYEKIENGNTHCKIICPICRKVYESLNKLNTHLRKDHKEFYKRQTKPLADIITVYNVEGEDVERIVDHCGCCNSFFPVTFMKHHRLNEMMDIPEDHKWASKSRARFFEREEIAERESDKWRRPSGAIVKRPFFNVLVEIVK